MMSALSSAIALLGHWIAAVGRMPVDVIVAATAGPMMLIDTARKALAALLAAAAAGGTVVLAIIGLLGTVQQERVQILANEEAIHTIEAEHRDVRRDIRATDARLAQLISRVDLLICELRYERIGRWADDCPQRGMLR